MKHSENKPRLLIAMRSELPEAFFGSREWARLNAIADIIPGFPHTDFDTAEGAEALAEADILLAAWMQSCRGYLLYRMALLEG